MQAQKTLVNGSELRLDLLGLVAHDVHLKRHSNTHGGEFAGPCPFCKDGKDRFVVWPNMAPKARFWCRVCGRKGDALDYIMQIKNIGFKQALDEAGIVDYTTPKGAAPIIAPSLAGDNVEIASELFDSLKRDGLVEACQYFTSYGIDIDTVINFDLGTYSYLDGYTIPWYWTKNDGSKLLKAIKVRRRNVEIGGRKYTQFKTLNPTLANGIFNDRWVSNPDGSRQGPKVPFVFINEDEKSAMMLDQFYPAVAYKEEHSWDHYLPKIFEQVGQVIICVHNDEPGRMKAIKLAEKLKHKAPIMVCHSVHKDLADFAKAEGTKAVVSWLKSRVPIVNVFDRSKETK